MISRKDPGVETVSVSLTEGRATVGYDWSVTDQDIIAGKIILRNYWNIGTGRTVRGVCDIT